MEAITYFAEQSMKKSVPSLRPGDTVRVHQRIREGNKERVQIFEGVVIAVRGGKAINSSFVVRRIASGVGVEKTFPLHSPNVIKVERLKSSKVRQARLFYMRERFGRTARMAGEIRNTEDWFEGKGDEANTDAEIVAEETSEEVTESEPVEESTEDEEQTEPETSESESETESEDAKDAEASDSDESEEEEDDDDDDDDDVVVVREPSEPDKNKS